MKRTISVADYFIEFLIAHGVSDVFGYQGGMIAYIFDSLGKYKNKINYHSCATEQGAALAACGYAQASNKIGVAISTSGPGFTNLLTGIADAWFDSLPVLFISGNVNTKDKKRGLPFRQLGFQEIQAAEIAGAVTKRTYEMELGSDYTGILRDAYVTAMSDRKGPVFIDLPINVCRETVRIESVKNMGVKPDKKKCDLESVLEGLRKSERPIIIAGAGIKQANEVKRFREWVDLIKIPVVSSLPAIDVLPTKSEYNMGYIGGTGRREAGLALQNADFVLAVGVRLCSKQIGHNMDLFAPKALDLIRVDVDNNELKRELKKNEVRINMDVTAFLEEMMILLKQCRYSPLHSGWAEKCHNIRRALWQCDITEANRFVGDMTDKLPDDANILLDVGKNLIYGAQSAQIKEKTTIFVSAGLGTMGYALPAAIGAYYGNRRPTYAIMGDGGAQMNIQELNTIAKNRLPIKIIILNNRALGNIRTFQEQYLDSRYVATSEDEGDYFSCDFSAIAEAYGIKTCSVTGLDVIGSFGDILTDMEHACLIEVVYDDCDVLPGIVAGGEFLKEGTGIPGHIIEEVLHILGKQAEGMRS